MAWEKKHGDVTLFANDRKTKETQPDFRGTVHLKGVNYELVLWNRVSKNGNAFLAGRVGDEVKPPEEKGSFPDSPRPVPTTSVKDALNDDLPW